MSVCLALLRVLLAGWVGAAALFVVVGIREVTSPALDAYARDTLVLVRFPAFYVYGSASLGLALACCLLIRSSDVALRRKWNWCLGLIVAAGLLMAADYFAVYRPLAAMLLTPGAPRPTEFTAYHNASKWVNAAGWALTLLAAVLACRPVSWWDLEEASDPAGV